MVQETKQLPDTRAYYVEGRESWKKEYGTIVYNLPTIIRALAFIQKYSPLDKDPLRIVDFGCAYGYYLSILKSINPKHDLYGVDCSKEAVEAAAAIIGVDRAFLSCCGDKLPLEDNSVDVILCFDVIEHLQGTDTLISFLKECARMLKPNGFIFIRTPNCNLPMKIVFKLAGQSWIYNGADHPNPMTEAKLVKIMRPYFKVIDISYTACVPLKYSLLRSLKISPHFTTVSSKVV